MEKGLVIRSTGSSYEVLLREGVGNVQCVKEKNIQCVKEKEEKENKLGEVCECHVKGNFRIRGIRSTNPVAVGDEVMVSRLQDGTNWIVDICERRNYIVRRSTNLSKQSHIIAANVDLAVLVVTLRHPETSLTFIDRFLATAEAYRVEACLVFNKVDLLTADEKEELERVRAVYEQIGYKTYAISALTATADDFQFLAGKVALFSGNSGVGKSTLLNALLGQDIARTGAISAVHDKGMHTTTFSEMYRFGDGWIIDTPGIKGFGVLEMEREEIGHYFREIFHASAECRFGNCTHTDEPQCAVLEAVKRGDIAASRFNSYLSMLGDIDEQKYR